LAGETEVLGENCPSAALSTTNPTNPGSHGGKPATNRLSYGMDFLWWLNAFNVSRFGYHKIYDGYILIVGMAPEIFLQKKEWGKKLTWTSVHACNIEINIFFLDCH
jgi:hypothetical protein